MGFSVVIRRSSSSSLSLPLVLGVPTADILLPGILGVLQNDLESWKEVVLLRDIIREGDYCGKLRAKLGDG